MADDTLSDARPWWCLTAGLFHRADCARLLAAAEAQGWQPGTYADGSRRDHVTVCFLNDGEVEIVTAVIARLREHAAVLARLFRVDVWPQQLTSIQVARYRPGDHYSYHRDNDETQRALPADRKLSIYVSLSASGGIDIEGIGPIHCNVGDALIYSGLVTHAAPMQEAGERHSFVAWIPGPRWR